MTKIIAIEGADQVGKETQSRLLANHLKESGYKVALVEVPIVSNLVSYRLIYWMLSNGLARRFPNVFQFVHFMNKYIFQESELLRMKQEYDYIIFDRWSLSSVIYGNRDGAAAHMTLKMYGTLMSPDLTIVLHGQPFGARQDDAYEKDRTFQACIVADYVVWVASHVDHRLIMNEGNPLAVHHKVIEALQDAKLL